MVAQRESFSMSLRLVAPTGANSVSNRIHGCLLGQLLRSQSPQFFVDQRQELFGCLRIALLDCGKDSRDVAHTGPEGAFKRSLSIAAYDLPNPLHAAHAAAFDHSKLEGTYFNERSNSAAAQRAFLARLPATGLIPAKGLGIRHGEPGTEIRMSSRCRSGRHLWFVFRFCCTSEQNADFSRDLRSRILISEIKFPESRREPTVFGFAPYLRGARTGPLMIRGRAKK